jgi:transcriptional regulator with XRE-family HTH domain
MTKLKRILQEKGINQSKLARMTNLEICQVSNICNGKQKTIYLNTAKRIAKALNMTLDEIFSDENEM